MRPELVGGGLVRSIERWQDVKKRGRERVKGLEANMILSRLRAGCVRFKGLNPMIYTPGVAKKLRADARELYCYWDLRELGYELTTIGMRLGMSVHGIGYAVRTD